MIKTVQLLEDKNAYLTKFISLNIARIQKLKENDFNGLEEFRETRENILNIIKHIDHVVEGRIQSVDANMITLETKKYINQLLIDKDELVRTILNQDIEIMQMIDLAKTQIILELQKVGKLKKTMGSYKGFEEKEESLDEEY